MLKTHAPDSLEYAVPHPSLESQMTGAAGTVLARDHFPLAARAQNIQDAIQRRTVRHARPTVGSGWLVGWQDGFDQFPQIVRDFAESVPLLGFLAHRNVLHDLTMFLSALTTREHEGF